MTKRIRRRAKHRGWTKDHRLQLETGCDWFEGAWGNSFDQLPLERRHEWPTPEIEAEMRDAWEQFRDELMAEAADTLKRPWAWWEFDFPEQFPDVEIETLQTLHPEPGLDDAEVLDRLGLLSETAISQAARDPMVTRGVLNDAYHMIFRRGWGWWRFVSPERRDYDKLEVVQLLELERRGAEVLSDREKYIIAHKADVPVFVSGCGRFALLPAAEVKALGLPDKFIDEDSPE